MQILGNIGSLPFISWAISMKLSDYYFFMPITDVPSFGIGPVVFAPDTQTYATELKKWTII
jgi:uncharacterized metal-binding protein